MDQGFSDADGVVGTSDTILEPDDTGLRDDDAAALDEALEAREQLKWKRVDCVPAPEPDDPELEALLEPLKSLPRLLTASGRRLFHHL